MIGLNALLTLYLALDFLDFLVPFLILDGNWDIK